MGIILRSNVDASAYASKAITSVSRGLLGMFFTDTSIDKAKNDFGIASNATANVVGTPVASLDNTQFLVGQNYIQTDIHEPQDMTFAIVLRSLYPAADAMADVNKQPFAAGNYATSGLSGIALGYSHPANGRLAFGRVLEKDGQPLMHNTTLASSIDSTQWQLVWGTFNLATGIWFVRAETANVNGNPQGEPGWVPRNNPRPISIGYAGGASQNGPVQVSQLRLYGVALDRETEIAAIVAEMRRYELTHNGRVV